MSLFPLIGDFGGLFGWFPWRRMRVPDRYTISVDKYELGERVSDADALASDWQTIGDDMRRAMGGS